MSEDFNKKLDFEMKQKRITAPVSPVARMMNEISTQAFANLQQHVTDCQATGNRAYAEMVKLAKELRDEMAELKASREV